MANATSTAAAAAAAKSKAAKAALKALKQRNNENSTKFFSAGIAGIVIIFALFHWTRFLYRRVGSGKGFLKGPASVTRVLRKALIRKVPGFTSAGHGIVFLAYLATSLSVLFVHINWTTLKDFAMRLGWLSAANLTLVVFLSLKNTPIAFLTSYTHEKLQPLHQISGYATIATTLTHGVVFIVTWYKQKNLHELLERVQIMAYVAGFSMLIILATTFFIRRRQYELFHIIHMTFAALIIITSAMHRPKYLTKSVYIMIFAGSIWGADRVLRFIRISFSAIGNSAIITPLPHGGTRIVLKKPPPFAAAGKHCFLWIPRVRSTETHPFTIVSVSPFEMVVSAYDGFTKQLHSHAVRNPGKALMAAIDGPYGSVPNFAIGYTKVVFIAGGSGASFTCGVAVDLLRKLGETSTTSVDFTWVVRDKAQLKWFATQLEELSSSPIVNLRIHNTSASHTSEGHHSETEDKIQESIGPSSSSASANIDMEKSGVTSTWSPISLTVASGRPDVASIITEVVTQSSSSDRIAVVACGPHTMMLAARKSVADNIKTNGPALELQAEHFGW